MIPDRKSGMNHKYKTSLKGKPTKTEREGEKVDVKGAKVAKEEPGEILATDPMAGTAARGELAQPGENEDDKGQGLVVEELEEEEEHPSDDGDEDEGVHGVAHDDASVTKLRAHDVLQVHGELNHAELDLLEGEGDKRTGSTHNKGSGHYGAALPNNPETEPGNDMHLLRGKARICVDKIEDPPGLQRKHISIPSLYPSPHPRKRINDNGLIPNDPEQHKPRHGIAQTSIRTLQRNPRDRNIQGLQRAIR